MGLDIPQIIHAPSATRPPVRQTPPIEERPSLPSLGVSISRPSSRLSTASTRSLSSGCYELAARQNMQLPGLNALASIAANTPPPEVVSRAQTPQMSFFSFTPTPSGTTGGVGAAPPCCQNCSTSTTPLWRRDENGSVLCNACGLFLKLHGRPRPISLKTDVIKSRNRVKAQQAKGKKCELGVQNGGHTISLAASHPGIARLDPNDRPMINSASTERSNSPLSRSATPGLGGVNIAPQHLFDQVVQMPGDYVPSPSMGHQFSSFRANSPGAASTSSFTANGLLNGGPTSSSTHYDQQDMTSIKTRVSELEVINDLFRGRVLELESTVEQERIEKESLTRQLEEARRRIEELEGDEGRKAKKPRIEDFVREDIDVDASGSDE